MLRNQESDDRSLTDILTESLSNRTLTRNKARRDELFVVLLPLLAYYCLRLRNPTIDEDVFTKCISDNSFMNGYNIDYLEDALLMELMIKTDKEKKTYSFRHTIYQEYFAAQYLAKEEDARQEALKFTKQHLTGKHWYNCLRLMMPLLSEDVLHDVFETICSINNTELFGVVLSGLKPSQLKAITLPVVPVVLNDNQPKNLLEQKFINLCKTANKESLTALGLTDPRVWPLTLSKSEVNTVFSSSVVQRLDKEQWSEQFSLNGMRYQLAKYPVTNLEFHKFVVEGGYDKNRGSRYWGSMPLGRADNGGIKWLHDTQPEYPRYWALADESRKSLRQPNCPVVGVTMYEAKAYCEWLSNRDENTNNYRLPRAIEWMWTAYSRWPSVRDAIINILPDNKSHDLSQHVSKPLQTEIISAMVKQIEPELLNYGPNPVGIVYDAESMCADIFGNVWEWCDTLLDDYRLCVQGGPRPACSLQSLLFDGAFKPDQRNDLIGFRILRELNTENE